MNVSDPPPPDSSAPPGPQEQDPQEEGPGESARVRFFATFPSIMLPMFLAAIDQTIVATALPAIAADLGEVERVSWVVVAYLVAATIAAPVYGRLGDLLGRRKLLFVALGLFIVASLACALAPSILVLTVARVAQGLGGGGLMTLSQALIGEAVPARERGRYQGYLACVFVSASTFGPVAGGWLTQYFGWKTVFSANIPLGLLAMAVATRLPRRSAAIPGGRLHFDVLGVILFSGFIAPLLLALEQAQRLRLSALPWAAGLATFAAFSLWLLLRQERVARVPLLPVSLLRQPGIWHTDALAFFHGAYLVSLITYLPIYLQVARGAGPGQAGLLLLPLTMLIAVGSIATGRAMSRTGLGAIFPSFGMPAIAVLTVTLAFLIPHLSFRQIPFLFAALAVVCGTVMPVVQTTVQFVAGRAQLGAASATVQFSRSVGAAVGTALVGAVLFATLAASDRETAQMFAAIVEMGPQALAGLPAARVAVVQGEIAEAFRIAFLAIASFAAVGSVMAWTMPVRRIG